MNALRGRLWLLALSGALSAALLAGCGTTKAATAPLDDKPRIEKSAPPGEAIDNNLAREGERWMVEQAKRRASEHPAAPAPARQGAVPATSR